MGAVKDVIRNCQRCAEKAKKKCSQNVVVRPILSTALNDRGQVDLIDYRTLPDGVFKWILHYKEHLTTFSTVEHRNRHEEKVHKNTAGEPIFRDPDDGELPTARKIAAKKNKVFIPSAVDL